MLLLAEKKTRYWKEVHTTDKTYKVNGTEADHTSTEEYVALHVPLDRETAKGMTITLGKE